MSSSSDRSPQDAFLEAYDKHADALFRHCYFRVFDRDLAKDVVQEAFCRTWQYIAKGNIIDNLRAFLYKTALNIIIDNSRRAKEISIEALTQEGFDVPDTNAFISIGHTLEVHEIEKAVERLPSIYRESFVLRHIDGFSVKEIAEMIKEPENIVSVRIHRAIKKIQDDHEKNGK